MMRLKQEGVGQEEFSMRALVIDPYRGDCYEKDIPNTLAGVKSVVRGGIEFAGQLENSDIVYVNGDGEGRTSAHISDALIGILASKHTLTEAN